MITFREFQTQDANGLAQIYLEERVATFHWVNAAQFTLSDFSFDTEGEFILVAVSESTPVGFCSVWLPDNFIHHLYVSKRRQRQGVGTALLSAMLDRLPRPVRLKCVIKNKRACRFYERLGWTIEGQSPTGPTGAYYNYVLN